VTCVTPSENFFDGDLACCFAKLLYIFDCLVDLLLPPMRLGYDAAIARPCLVMMMVSPRSTSSSSWGRWVFASDA
jgi:hypothetical protein